MIKSLPLFILMFLYVRFMDPLYHGDYPIIMKKTAGCKLPKFSRAHSEQLLRSFDFIGINYYAIMFVKDHPQAAPSNKRDLMADISAKLIC
jgi:beta-glucosidase